MSLPVVYVLRQYLSDASQREIQLLRLADFRLQLEIVRQTQRNNAPFYDPHVRTVRKWPNPTGALRWLGLHTWKHRLDRFYFPSPTVLYVIPAERYLATQIQAQLRRGEGVCLITPVPPHDLLLAGLRLKKRFPKIRWIADWQDLWTHDQYYISQVPESRRNRVRDLEAHALHTADKNVFTNEFAAELMINKHSILREKVFVIPHAYEGEIAAHHADETFAVDRKLRIGFLGNLFKPPKVPGQRVIKALETVRAHGVNFDFHIFGDKYLENVCRAPIEGHSWIFAHDRVPHDESLRRLADCDLLLLILGDVPESKTILHAKLPFYLAQNKPILAIAPNDSAVADVIRQTGTGWVISCEEDWADALSRAISQARANHFATKRHDENIRQYSWENVSKRWLAVIDGRLSMRAFSVPSKTSRDSDPDAE